MKNYVHSWQWFTEFSLRWDTLQAEILEKTKSHILSNNLFSVNPSLFEIIWEKMV